MSKKSEVLKTRFILNMGRISGLFTLIFSEKIDVLKPTGFVQYEGVSADILRFAIVFLHATFEDVLRCQTHRSNKTMTFYSGADIEKALKRAGIDSKPFKSLYPPLTQMAKRRKRIVHDGDFSKSTDTVLEAFDIVDHLEMGMWNLAVIAFYYQMLISTNAASEVERKMHQNIREAMTSYLNAWKQLMTLPETPPELQREALQKVADTLESMLAALKLDVRSFLNEA